MRILRLLPERSDLEESGWGELLARAFFEDLKGQRESMADRISVFLEDMAAASGNIRNPETARGSFYQATRLKDQQFVALVKGGGSNETRERVFGGFNTPLLPEVLICTAVGQEGIDLHRHCRHVVHYDLPWNTALAIDAPMPSLCKKDEKAQNAAMHMTSDSGILGITKERYSIVTTKCYFKAFWRRTAFGDENILSR